MRDAFSEIAPYYDAIMSQVHYDRWEFVVRTLAELAPPGFRHVDVACGTGTLLRNLNMHRWTGAGVDMSFNMIQSGAQAAPGFHGVVGDMRALPVANVQYITCLFDSLNFLLEEDEVELAVAEFARALRPDGILFFDAVTERMVKEHFDGQEWIEENGPVDTHWQSTYDRRTKIAETIVQTNTGAVAYIRERVYARALLEKAVRSAGLKLFAVYDAETWRNPTRKTLRFHVVAAPRIDRRRQRQFNRLAKRIRSAIT